MIRISRHKTEITKHDIFTVKMFVILTGNAYGKKSELFNGMFS